MCGHVKGDDPCQFTGCVFRNVCHCALWVSHDSVGGNEKPAIGVSLDCMDFLCEGGHADSEMSFYRC